jgi:hypothetical protein
MIREVDLRYGFPDQRDFAPSAVRGSHPLRH